MIEPFASVGAAVATRDDQIECLSTAGAQNRGQKALGVVGFEERDQSQPHFFRARRNN